MAVRLEGTLTQWDDERGFGFVSTRFGTRTFVHISELGSGIRRPVVGDYLTWTAEMGTDGRAYAAAVRIAGERNRRSARQRIVVGTIIALLVVAALATCLYLGTTYRHLSLWAVGLYLGASVVTFVVYGLDKRDARLNRRRVPENTLLALDVIGGWPGGLLAQQVFRHKTRKTSYQMRFWIAVAVNLSVIGYFLLR